MLSISCSHSCKRMCISPVNKMQQLPTYPAALICERHSMLSKLEQVISPIQQRVPNGRMISFQFINLTRNSSMLRHLELDVLPLFYLFSSVYERKHMPDRSMPVLYPASAVVSSSCFIYEPVKSTKLAFSRNTLLSVPSGNLRSGTPPCLRNSSSKNSPMPSEFQFKEPPLALGIPKSRPWCRCGHFLELPIVAWRLACCCWCGSPHVHVVTQSITNQQLQCSMCSSRKYPNTPQKVFVLHPLIPWEIPVYLHTLAFKIPSSEEFPMTF